MIKLCYKEYPYKLNLAACKAFHEQTGKDANYVLLRYLEACVETQGMGAVERLRHFFGLETFETISKLLHCVIQQENKSVPLAEIQDAMFRVSWMPTNEDSDMCEPWPMVVVDLSTQVNEYFSSLDKKKAVT